MFIRNLLSFPKSYFALMRLAKAEDMLGHATLSVGDIASECGYDNAESFSLVYRAQFNTSPSRDWKF